MSNIDIDDIDVKMIDNTHQDIYIKGIRWATATKICVGLWNICDLNGRFLTASSTIARIDFCVLCYVKCNPNN